MADRGGAGDARAFLTTLAEQAPSVTESRHRCWPCTAGQLQSLGVAGSILGVVSTAEQSDEPRVTAYPPEEALRRAQPLPSQERLVLEDVSEDDWTAFREALAEA